MCHCRRRVHLWHRKGYFNTLQTFLATLDATAGVTPPDCSADPQVALNYVKSNLQQLGALMPSSSRSR